MDLRRRALRYAIVAAMAAVMLIWIILFAWQYTAVDQLERRYGQDTKNMYASFLEREAQVLLETVSHWAIWDDMYAFSGGRYPTFWEDTNHHSELDHVDVDYAAVIDSQGSVIYDEHTCQLCVEEYQPAAIAGLDTLWQDVLEHEAGRSIFVLVPDGPMLVAAHPILPSSQDGAAEGVLVFGRMVETTLLQQFQAAETLTVSVVGTEHSLSGGLLRRSRELRVQIPLQTDPYPLVGYLELQIPRDLSRLVETSVWWGMLLLSALVVALILLLSHGLRGRVIEPLERLMSEIEAVGHGEDSSLRVTVPSETDEISRVAQQFNLTLDRLEKAQQRMAKREAYLSYITGNVHELIVELDETFIIHWSTPSVRQQLGFEPGEFVKRPLASFIHSDDRAVTFRWLTQLPSQTPSSALEVRFLQSDGTWTWMELLGQALDASILLSARNIEQRRRDQERIAYLSYFDSVTEVHNRTYLEQVLEALEAQAVAPISVIMVDVNGLKLANDTFGHEEGDRLLHRTAKLLQEALKPDDVLGRWGGDEFVIFLPGADTKRREAVRKAIVENFAAAEGAEPIKPSVSLGDATRKTTDTSLRQLIAKAEERMYRHKLTESRSARSAIIASLQTSLSEKTMETHEHGERMKFLASALGQRLGFSASQLDELALAVMLHDIGKVAVPDHILTKAESLTEEEWQLVKNHPEVGFRIAAASPELAAIADHILHHHEHWNGGGYPQGLSGAAIPVQSRIIALVDAFDVMTNQQPYAQPLGVAAAIAELQRCAGSQFDPQLTKEFAAVLDEVYTTRSAGENRQAVH